MSRPLGQVPGNQNQNQQKGGRQPHLTTYNTSNSPHLTLSVFTTHLFLPIFLQLLGFQP